MEHLRLLPIDEISSAQIVFVLAMTFIRGVIPRHFRIARAGRLQSYRFDHLTHFIPWRSEKLNELRHALFFTAGW